MKRFQLVKDTLKMLAACAVSLLVAASCGGDSTEEPGAEPATTDNSSAETDAPATTEVDATTKAPEDTEPTEDPVDTSMFDGTLVGLFGIDPASCDGDDVTGSYFTMIQPGGDLSEGPFVPNADSTCTDTTLTPLMPGTDGGLTAGTYQPAPDPPFDEAGNGLSSPIVQPATFFAVAFSIATSEEGNIPAISATDGVLSGDLSAWTAYYGNLIFQQGAPRPDGSLPGLTSEVMGTIDSETGDYTLEWSSQIEGGAFNEFTGVWHIEGTFQPSG